MTTKNKWKLMAATGILLIACTAQKHVAYELPEAMLPHVKVEYVKICDRGQVLYDLNCGGCHNSKRGRKVIRPDFKPEQLTGYTLRVSNARHESAMPDSLVTEEELGIIMTFLSYKKKNTATAAH
jgi:mono/diheme cytochrome c family protein